MRWNMEAARPPSLLTRFSKELHMTEPLLIQGTQLLLTMILIVLADLLQQRGREPQFLGSVGWHGGKTKG